MKEYTKIDYDLDGIGAGLDGDFSNTKELRPMKYDEAMTVDEKGWTEHVDAEHERTVTNKVWRPVKLEIFSLNAKILTLTWACKLKSNGVKRARINGQGYEQVDGLH